MIPHPKAGFMLQRFRRGDQAWPWTSSKTDGGRSCTWEPSPCDERLFPLTIAHLSSAEPKNPRPINIQLIITNSPEDAMIQRFVHTLPPKVLKPALIMWHPLTDSRVEFYMFMLILILHRQYVYIYCIFVFLRERHRFYGRTTGPCERLGASELGYIAKATRYGCWILKLYMIQCWIVVGVVVAVAVAVWVRVVVAVVAVAVAEEE